MKSVMGIIYTNKDDLSLRELTSQRSVAALPLAGRYRVVDFILSSMANSGIRNVGVIMQRNYRSLMDHLGAGKEWDLHTRNNGLFILPPFVTQENGGEYTGVLDALRANFDYLRRSNQKLAILTNSNMVFNMNFESMIRRHEETDADITLLYTKVRKNMELGSTNKRTHAFLQVDEEGRVTDMEVNPNAASYDNMYMNVLLVKRTLLIHLVDGAAAHGSHDINRELLQPSIKSGSLKVYGYEFTGYYRRIETIKSYFRCNMDLLDAGVRRELFNMTNPVYTKTRDDVPAIYRDANSVRNSLVGDGCVIEGNVENCVLFRGVHIGRGASVKNAIIMQDSEVEDFVELENVILDKNVTIRNHGRLIGQSQYPIVIGKNVTL